MSFTCPAIFGSGSGLHDSRLDISILDISSSAVDRASLLIGLGLIGGLIKLDSLNSNLALSKDLK